MWLTINSFTPIFRACAVTLDKGRELLVTGGYINGTASKITGFYRHYKYNGQYLLSFRESSKMKVPRYLHACGFYKNLIVKKPKDTLD